MINTLSNILFPLITFPYASRILLSEGIGHVQFFSSAIDYIILLTSLGIPLYGIKTISKVKNDPQKLSVTTVEILSLHTIMTFLGYVIVYLLIISFQKFQQDIPLLLFLSSSLILNAIGVQWFYQGVEDFKYITIRSLIVKLISLIVLFLFVKTKEDIIPYAMVNIVGIGVGNIFNFIRLRRYIKIRYIEFKNINISQHLRPAIIIFTLNLIISIYTGLDTLMLGFMSGDQSVGLYTAAVKMNRLILGVFGALSFVLLPRLSSLIFENNYEDFRRIAQKGIYVAYFISLPAVILLQFYADSIIHILTGTDYEPAIKTLRIIAPSIIFIAISNILGIQILFPQGKEKFVIISTVCGAFINFTINLILIPVLSQDGAAVSIVIAELIVTVIMYLIGKKFIPVKLFNADILKYFFAGGFMIIMLLLLRILFPESIGAFILGSAFAILCYCIFLYMSKDSIILECFSLINRRHGNGI